MLDIYKPSEPLFWRWVSLSGPDAEDFLHRLTTVNVRALSPGKGSPGCFLSAQGKVRAFFTLWKLSKDEYGFEFDSGRTGKWLQDLLSVIDQFTFAEKIQVSEKKDWDCVWIFGNEAATIFGIQAGEIRLDSESGVRIGHHGNIDFGRPWISAWGTKAELMNWKKKFGTARSLNFSELEHWRIKAGRPWIDSEITDSTIPLEAGLVDAISSNKGCYPGQEVIEKIISLGAPARRLAQMEGEGTAPKAGDSIFSGADKMEIGKVTSVFENENNFIALGYVRKTHSKEGQEIVIDGNTKAHLKKIAPYV